MRKPIPDLILAGGGLAGCLIALRIARRYPGARIRLVEAGPALGGNHTWSFHAGDLDAAQHAFLAPLVHHRWAAQQVRFPRYTRRLDVAYFSITTESLRRNMASQHDVEVRTGSAITALGPDFVETDNGEKLRGHAVIDARGPGTTPGTTRATILGFQKFLGREVKTARPHGIDCPVIMDATVSQADGYRFVYLLPFDANTLLIEDTRYSDGAALAEGELDTAIDDYTVQQGWRIAETLREERGVLPIPLAGDFKRFWPYDDPLARAGLRAGLFHPTTGYSLPQAVALADAIAEHWPMQSPSTGRWMAGPWRGSCAGSNSQTMEKSKTAAVIGSGFGGLSLAIRLQAAGFDTTVLEKRDKPGGRVFTGAGRKAWRVATAIPAALLPRRTGRSKPRSGLWTPPGAA